MSEKSILIADQTGGEAIATRDATDQDVDSNARVIQLMDKTTRHMPTACGLNDYQVKRDSNGYSYGAGLTNGIFPVGDGETLVACLKFLYDDAQEGYVTAYDLEFGVTVIPWLVKDNLSDTPERIGVLSPHKFFPVTPYLDSMGSPVDSLTVNDGSHYFNVTSMFAWPLLGANYIQFSLNYDAEDSAAVFPDIRLYTWVLSGNSRMDEWAFDTAARPKDQGGY